MTPIVALVAAGVIVVFWRQIAAVVVWLVLALFILGVFTLFQPAEAPDEAPPATGITVETAPSS